MRTRIVLMILILTGCLGLTMAQRDYIVNDVPYIMATADFDRDGIPDLATIHPDSVCLLLGTGTGTFSQPARCYPADGGFPPGMVAGDFNVDTLPDLAIVNSNTDQVHIYLGNGDGTFQVLGPYGVGMRGRYLIVADFDNNGLPDLATSNQGTLDDPSSISILLGYGDGSFTAANPRDLMVAGHTVELASSDFNNDGCADLVSTNFGVEQRYGNTISFWLGNCDGTFQTGTNIIVGRGPRAAAVADFDGNGCQDLVITNQVDNSYSTLLGNCLGEFQQLVTPVCDRGVDTPFTIAASDLNDDGRFDLVLTCRFGEGQIGSTSVLLGNGDGSFQTATHYLGGRHPHSIAIGDFDGDKKKDLATSNHHYPGFVSILLGDGAGGFAPPAAPR